MKRRGYKMGYITRQRVYPIKKDDNVPPMMSPRTQTELEIH
jgi:hypothetical protein